MNALKAVGMLIICCGVALGDDWPQWMGPKRDNVWRETGIISRFPTDGPKVLWRSPVAGGYAGPAVAQGLVIVCDYITSDNVKVGNFERNKFTGVERVLALDERTGDVKWTHELEVDYTISYPSGPRCTPIVDGGMVYTLGAEGNLFCLRADSGEVVWSKEFQPQYSTKAALWGYAGHPLIDGNKLICVVGGEGSHAVAYDKDTGEQIWSVLTSKDQGYSPPTIIEAAGQRQLILFRPDAVSAVNPENGEPLWSVPYEAKNGLVVMSPIQLRDHLFVGGYSDTNMLIKLAADEPGAHTVWKNLRKKAMSPMNVQPFLDGNVLYGVDQSGEFMAIDVMSGDRLWQTSWPLGKRPARSGTTFIVRQADRYWLFNDQGELIIAKLTPQGHEEIDRTKLVEPTNVAFGRSVVWSAPAFANQHVYVRNDKECICVDLSSK